MQFRNVIQLQYTLSKGQMKINVQDDNNNYFSHLDEIEIKPDDIDINDFEISDNVVTMQFSKPIICNVKSGKYHSYMLCGAKLEGKEKDKTVERLESLTEKLGYKKNEDEGLL